MKLQVTHRTRYAYGAPVRDSFNEVRLQPADTTRQRAVLSELEAGPRREAIAQARAQLVQAQAQASEAQATYRRLAALGKGRYVAAIDIDRAREIASGEDPIPVGPKRELEEGDRIYVGAWTRIVVRRATDDEKAAAAAG